MRSALSLVFLILSVPALAADKPFLFQKNDRIVFLGDSITEQYQYSTDLELYLTTRFPNWNLTFLNAGIGGDTANGGAGRFQSHVLDEQPTAITINFGMNDAGYGKFDPARNKQYVEKTAAMLEMAKKAGVRVALLSPNAVDRRGRENFKLYLETQKEFYAPLKDLAAQFGNSFVDQYAVTRAALEKMEADKAEKVVPFGDGFHTASPGGLFMAHAILTGLGAPAQVSNATIDAGSKAAQGDGCKIDGLAIASGSVTFDRTDMSIPIPVQKDWVSLLPYVNNLADLNYYGLTLKGLPEGNYTISIDGAEVAKASADELAKGMNLGNATSGPIWEQGNKVLQAINAKNQIVHGRFRGVLMFQAPDWLADVAKERKPQELVKRKELIDAKQAEIYRLVLPVSRKFEIKLTN
jgi:lysophospholipase L1-like esterase